ncbi:MAG: hypothetical protein QXT68_00935 [Halobacteria archaeon]
MDKTKGIGAGLLLASVVLVLAWLWWMASSWSNPTRLVHTLAVLTTLALLAILGLVAWIGYTMATMKVEVPAPPPPAAPAPAEKKS